MRGLFGLHSISQKTIGIRYAFMMYGLGIKMKDAEYQLDHWPHHKHIDNAANAQKATHQIAHARCGNVN